MIPLTPADFFFQLRTAAFRLGCEARESRILHGDVEIGHVRTQWVATRPDGRATFHRNPAQAVIALLQTHYS